MADIDDEPSIDAADAFAALGDSVRMGILEALAVRHQQSSPPPVIVTPTQPVPSPYPSSIHVGMYVSGCSLAGGIPPYTARILRYTDTSSAIHRPTIGRSSGLDRYTANSHDSERATVGVYGHILTRCDANGLIPLSTCE
jgi:hypothetical protein